MSRRSPARPKKSFGECPWRQPPDQKSLRRLPARMRPKLCSIGRAAWFGSRSTPCPGAAAEVIRKAVAENGGGHATLIRAPAETRGQISSVRTAAARARRSIAAAEGGVRSLCDFGAAPHVDGILRCRRIFSPAQLKNPATAEAEKILRTCVHCGFCNATCPTFVLLGDERDSPRGRIYFIKDMLEHNRAADAVTVKHIDRCLSCLACMTACPSGVNYMHLVDEARSYIEKTYRRPLADRLSGLFSVPFSLTQAVSGLRSPPRPWRDPSAFFIRGLAATGGALPRCFVSLQTVRNPPV